MLTYNAPAKINYLLNIIGQRDDGYHLLQTVFQFIDLSDQLTFTLTDHPDIHCTSDSRQLIDNDNNIVTLAAKRLQTAYHIKQGATIHIKKNIPIGGGLGGGSSDAATTLMALNKLWKIHTTLENLHPIGLSLGADVPVFLFGKSCWAEGIGEKMHRIDLTETWILLVFPKVHVSTQHIFQDQHLIRDSSLISLDDFKKGIRTNNTQALVCKKFEAVQHALTWLGKYALAMMSGTGATIYAAFNDKETGEAVLQQLPKHWRGRLCKAMNETNAHQPITY